MARGRARALSGVVWGGGGARGVGHKYRHETGLASRDRDDDCYYRAREESGVGAVDRSARDAMRRGDARGRQMGEGTGHRRRRTTCLRRHTIAGQAAGGVSTRGARSTVAAARSRQPGGVVALADWSYAALLPRVKCMRAKRMKLACVRRCK